MSEFEDGEDRGGLGGATSYHDRRLADRLKDPEFRAEYESASAEIAQIDAVLRILDHLRVEAG